MSEAVQTRERSASDPSISHKLSGPIRAKAFSVEIKGMDDAKKQETIRQLEAELANFDSAHEERPEETIVSSRAAW